jgi:hypothetical protein
MAKVIAQLENPQGKLADMLGMSLGQGLGNGLNTFFANRSLESVLHDKALEGAPQSKKLEALRSALSPYGEKGQEIFNQRMQIEQLEASEKSQQAKGKALSKFQKGEALTDKEWAAFTPQEVAALQKAYHPKSPISQTSVPKEQIDAMKKAHDIPGYEFMNESEKYQALVDSGVSAENAIKEATLYNQQLAREDKKVDTSYKDQKDFIDSVTNSYKGFETEMKPRLLQMQSMNPEELVSPTGAVFLEALGIPLGALENPSSELYQKLSQDLLKGLPETYGNRILKVEVENFLKTIPTLLNSPDGRRMIASNMLKLGEMKEVYYNAMRDKQRQLLDQGKPFPKDFEQAVFDQVKPQIDRINNEFIKMAEVKSVPPNTVPFFSPDGEIKFVPKDQVEWATQNGGRRIW